MALRWVSQNCQNAKLILKADDDIFINIFKLVGHKSVASTICNTKCYIISLNLFDLIFLISSCTLNVRPSYFFDSILQAKIASKTKIGIRFELPPPRSLVP